jgi:hypothetical protein
VTVISTNQWIKGSYDRRAAAKHQPEPYQPKGWCTDTKIHQVLHQNISVFFALVNPASHMENPSCMKNTNAAPINTQIVLTAL